MSTFQTHPPHASQGWVHEGNTLHFLGGGEAGFGITANIAIVGDYAYIGFLESVATLDVSDRTKPHFTQGGGLIVTGSINTGMAVVERYACFAFQSDSWYCFTNTSLRHDPVDIIEVEAWAVGPAAAVGDYV